jgi:hypothetical protein
MRTFFALLLIGNIAFAVFQWLLPYEQLFVETRKIPAAEELQVLSEANTEIVKQVDVLAEAQTEAQTEEQAPIAVQNADQSEGVAQGETVVETPPVVPESSEPYLLVTEDDSDKRVCYTIGPVKDKARAIEISGRYSGKRIDTSLKSSLEKQYMGVMVYIGGHKNRADALKTANKLSAKGLSDHIIINQPDQPDQPNLLSLGVFGLKKNADRLAYRVKRLGFPAKTEARYRERTIYWVYAEQSSEDELMRLLNQTEFDDGISQIPTQCLPS